MIPGGVVNPFRVDCQAEGSTGVWRTFSGIDRRHQPWTPRPAIQLEKKITPQTGFLAEVRGHRHLMPRRGGIASCPRLTGTWM